MTPFLSNTADVTYEGAWLPISDTVEVTKLPLADTAHVLFARLGGGAAKVLLEARGWRLPTCAEYDQLHAHGLHIEPYVLPTDEPTMLLEAGIALHDRDAIERFREANMMTEAWCHQHDNEVMKRLAAAGWKGEAVDNCGKHWAAPDASTPPGHSLIYGWWTPRARAYGVHNDVMIQERSPFHDDRYDDYATTIHAARTRT